MAQNSTLKASFGTSKYCLNFLKESCCESEVCPFLHYIERRRDKVIHDDAEFKDFINTQDRIVDKFLKVLSLDSVRDKNEFYGDDKEEMNQYGLPGLSFIFDKKFDQIKIDDDSKTKLMGIEFLTFKEEPDAILDEPKSDEGLVLPNIDPI